MADVNVTYVKNSAWTTIIAAKHDLELAQKRLTRVGLNEDARCLERLIQNAEAFRKECVAKEL